MTYTSLPIGIDDFEEIITKEYYYVDKTWFIKELLDKKGKVNLFTRPRRFGKTLNLSMLRYFFELPKEEMSNKALFEGLKILEAGEKYTKEQEQYPVITLTLKSAKQSDFDLAYKKMRESLAREFRRHEIVLSKMENAKRKEKYIALRDEQAEYSEYLTALFFLSECLYDYYKKKVIILIDEYDVPLENAFYSHFYERMIGFIRSLFESALKTNPYLEFSVITGCLRISKESIFTGLNNLKMVSILNEDYGEYFGFVEEEVRQMLTFYHREEKMDIMKVWYDGYLFGTTEVYNPWSVINYTERLYSNEEAFPTAVWSNTSSNSIVKDLIYHAKESVKEEIELLVKGESIEKQVHEEITYEDVYESEENLWNFLFFTGYLKMTSMRMVGVNRYVTMTIPNDEVRYIYENTIANWFRDEIKVQNLTTLYEAMLTGDEEVFQQELGKQLQKTISYMDSKEAFYQGFILGVLANLEGYRIKSNRESGDGRYDILVYSLDIGRPPVIIELKVAQKFRELEISCEKALKQIRDKKYDSGLVDEGYSEVIHYGIGFFKKQVRIQMVRKELEEEE